jgi:hypothetical protein
MRSAFGPTINGLAGHLAFPASVVYTRPSHLRVEGTTMVFPLHLKDAVEEQLPGKTILVERVEYDPSVRAEYALACSGR